MAWSEPELRRAAVVIPKRKCRDEGCIRTIAEQARTISQLRVRLAEYERRAVNVWEEPSQSGGNGDGGRP